jgi:hypothetical protein
MQRTLPTAGERLRERRDKSRWAAGCPATIRACCAVPRIGAAPGIAGSCGPKAEGVFLHADEFDASFFVRMNNTGVPVDVWAAEEPAPATWVCPV